jgi:hypothetical protein
MTRLDLREIELTPEYEKFVEYMVLMCMISSADVEDVVRGFVDLQNGKQFDPSNFK